ncbi:MAG TPA: UbiH/UbiF/VisC/COQ6 family ubiquinone biosynthesis hydroxylase [Stellaceae bacterium]|nr:UbiH/UbiF/VisC/COQ6 family ubiquinone biosynthesis hydroxylase [Stellaceae bacterium]
MSAPARRPDIAADVVVVGGGAAGMIIAIACADAGVRTVIIDRLPADARAEDRFDGRSFAVAYGSRRILETIGVWPLVEARAEPILEIRVADNNAPLFLHYDYREVGDQPLGHIVESRHLRRALLLRIENLADMLTPVAPAMVEGFESDMGGVSIHLADGRLVRGRLAIAADGKGSFLRQAAGIKTIEHRYGQDALTCTVRHEIPHGGIAVEHFLPAGPFAILPMTDNRSSVVWTERSDLAPKLMALDDPGFKRELERRFGDFLGALELEGPRWHYPISIVHAEQMTGPRLALVGDAAHAIHPIAGQGLNLGIRDVAVLAELIVDTCRLGLDPGSETLLAAYRAGRRGDTAALALVTDGLNRLFSNNIPPVKLVRDLGLAMVGTKPLTPVRKLLMRHAMGVLGPLPKLTRGERL